MCGSSDLLDMLSNARDMTRAAGCGPCRERSGFPPSRKNHSICVSKRH
jgi:hypothetical protein